MRERVREGGGGGGGEKRERVERGSVCMRDSAKRECVCSTQREKKIQ